ncbi:MAG: DUF5329 domain-containing protein [Pseudomonadota bacterium]|nr:DUF5329 domain-containing protein [Pseudomonadota bacterium]
MLNSRPLILALALALPGTSALAADPRTEDEIRHLLAFIETSGCTFIRNGNEYPSDEARDHIAMKYGYVRKKAESSEDVIRYVATKSSMTGRIYTVRCDGGEIPSAQWLTQELKTYRTSGLASGVGPNQTPH